MHESFSFSAIHEEPEIVFAETNDQQLNEEVSFYKKIELKCCSIFRQ
jgi:hypothetical protein